MRVWVTRAEPEASATAERLRQLGHQPFVAPVLEIRPTVDTPDIDGAAAIAFTSRNGVRAFPADGATRVLPAFAVGDATAETAKAAGFTDVRSAAGDGAALAALITSTLSPAAGAVLVARAEQAAFDLEGALAGAGFKARPFVVYESVALSPAAAVRDALGAQPPLEAVLVHSRRAAVQTGRILAGRPERAGLIAYCISKAAAGPLQGVGLKSVNAAPFPNEASLLKLLENPAEGP